MIEKIKGCFGDAVLIDTWWNVNSIVCTSVTVT